MEHNTILPPFLKLIFNEYRLLSLPFMEAKSLYSMIHTIENELAARRQNTSTTASHNLIDDEAKATLKQMEREGLETPVTEEDLCVLLQDLIPGLLESCANEPAILVHFDNSDDSERQGPSLVYLSSNEHPDPTSPELIPEDLALERAESLAGRVETLENENAKLTRRLKAQSEAEEQILNELESRIHSLEAERDDLKTKYQLTKTELQKKGTANSILEAALASLEQDLSWTRAEHEKTKRNELETKRRLKSLQVQYDASKNSLNKTPTADGTIRLSNHNGYPCVNCKKKTEELRKAIERLESEQEMHYEDNQIHQNTIDKLREELNDRRTRTEDEDVERGDHCPAWSFTSTTLDMLETGTFFNSEPKQEGDENFCDLASLDVAFAKASDRDTFVFPPSDQLPTKGTLHRTMSTQAGPPVGCLMERRTGPDEPISTTAFQDTSNEEMRRPNLVSTGTQCNTTAVATRSGMLNLTDSAIHCDSFPSLTTPSKKCVVMEAAVQCDLTPSYFHLNAEDTLVDATTSEIDHLFDAGTQHEVHLTDGALYPPPKRRDVDFGGPTQDKTLFTVESKAKERDSNGAYPEIPTLSDVRTHPKPKRLVSRDAQTEKPILSDILLYSDFLPPRATESDPDDKERSLRSRESGTMSKALKLEASDTRSVTSDSMFEMSERSKCDNPAMVDFGTNTPVLAKVDKFTVTDRDVSIANASVKTTMNRLLRWPWWLLLALLLVFWTASGKECVDAPAALVDSFPWETDVLPQLCYGRSAAVWKEGMYVVLNVLLGHAVMPT